MMKKEYIYPEMQVVELKMSTLMAGSPTDVSGEDYNNGTIKAEEYNNMSGSDDLDW